MMTVLDFIKKKQARQKISVVTCYDYTSATILDNTEVDCILVGDSGSMMMFGAKDTTLATMEQMTMLTAAVARGSQRKFIIADMPFMSYRKSFSASIEAVTALIQAGAQAVKLEGAVGNLELIRHVVESGVPVMGHIGLTPQHVHAFGGYSVQGKSSGAHLALVEQAQQLQAAGCFSLVLECVPWQLAREITDTIDIPTIGIGAGAETSGQVLVFHDLLGLQTEFRPKFVKQYLNGADLVAKSINQYAQDVRSGEFPLTAHRFEGEVV